MDVIDILWPNPNIITEETTMVAVICPYCGDREMAEIESSCLSPLEIITGELHNPGACPDCQDSNYLNCAGE